MNSSMPPLPKNKQTYKQTNKQTNKWTMNEQNMKNGNNIPAYTPIDKKGCGPTLFKLTNCIDIQNVNMFEVQSSNAKI